MPGNGWTYLILGKLKNRWTNTPVQGADAVTGAEGKTEGHDPRRVPAGPYAVEDSVYVWKLVARKLGDPKSTRWRLQIGMAGEGHAPYARQPASLPRPADEVFCRDSRSLGRSVPDLHAAERRGGFYLQRRMVGGLRVAAGLVLHASEQRCSGHGHVPSLGYPERDRA